MTKTHNSQENPVYTILHVDDEPEICEIVKFRFERLNYRVLEANSGKQALELFDQNKVDVAILDLSMPKMNGFELLKALRKRNSALPIIILTGLKDEKNVFLSLKFRCDSLMEKPIAFDLLVSSVQRILDGIRALKKAA